MTHTGRLITTEPGTNKITNDYITKNQMQCVLCNDTVIYSCYSKMFTQKLFIIIDQSQAMKLREVSFKMTKSIRFITTLNNNNKNNNLYLNQAILIDI